MRRRMAFACAVLAMAVAVSGTTAFAAAPPGFTTGRPSMLTKVMDGVTITPLLSVGDVVPDSGGYRFEAIPDGISVRTTGGQIQLFVNHETSKVPFPYNPSLATSEPGESQNDFDNAQVSKLILDPSGGVLSGSYVIPSSAGFQRFCSNFLATSKEGFTKDILFTNEESPDYVLRQTDSWPPALDSTAQEENGVVLALDVATGEYRTIYGMGRHNHENDVAIPGFDKLVVMSGDDTFTSGPLTIPAGGPNTATSEPSQSQLYSYQAGNTKTLLDDKGQLWAFVSDDPSFDDYYDFTPGSTHAVSGHFIKVPKTIATGKKVDGSEVKAADFGYPLPPTDGTWQREVRNPAIGIDGPQWVLEYWSQLNNVFDFVRVEDIAYDKRPDHENTVYIVDSGRGSAGVSQAGRSTNGRVWKMEFDPDDPKQVDSFSILVEGDDNEVKTTTEVHQPDNIETTQTGILLTEDPGSGQQFTPAQQISDAGRATTARLWYVPFSGTPQIVAKVDQGLDETAIDVDPADVGPPFVNGAFPISPGNWGAWESSGIVDASAAFGPGAFLIDVQAHTLWMNTAVGPDTFIDGDADTNPDYNFKREGGQLLLIRIPGI
jgi:hypothetical protein